MTRRSDLAAERHGSTASSGADSFKSTDTVRNIFHHSSSGSQRRRQGAPDVSLQTKDGDRRYVPLFPYLPDLACVCAREERTMKSVVG